MEEQRILKQFSEKIKMQFDVYDITIYKNNKSIFGKSQDNNCLERYLSLTCTTIFKGNSESSLATHIKVKNSLYIIVLHSNNEKAFDGVDTQYVINDIKQLQRKLGEVN